MVRQTTVSTPSSVWSLPSTVDPLILRQGKPVDLKIEIVRSGKRHPPQRGSLVILYPALPSRDREVVKPSEILLTDGGGYKRTVPQGA